MGACGGAMLEVGGMRTVEEGGIIGAGEEITGGIEVEVSTAGLISGSQYRGGEEDHTSNWV